MKLYKALKTIKEDCKKSKTCSECKLFGNDERCMFNYDNDAPEYWKLKKFKDMED